MRSFRSAFHLCPCVGKVEKQCNERVRSAKERCSRRRGGWGGGERHEHSRSICHHMFRRREEYGPKKKRKRHNNYIHIRSNMVDRGRSAPPFHQNISAARFEQDAPKHTKPTHFASSSGPPADRQGSASNISWFSTGYPMISGVVKSFTSVCGKVI